MSPPAASRWLSDDALLLARPFATSERLGAEPDAVHRRALPARLALYLLHLAAFVSLVTAGRLAPEHVPFTALAWSFLPMLQAASLWVALRVGGARRDLAPAFSRYLLGHAPWLLLLYALAAVCLFAPRVADAFGWMLSSGALPLGLAAALVWGAVINVAMLRRGVGLSRGRAALATLAFYLCLASLIVGYYTAIGDLLPLFGVTP